MQQYVYLFPHQIGGYSISGVEGVNSTLMARDDADAAAAADESDC